MDVTGARGSVLIIGGGIAGLWTALRLAPHPVTVVTAGALGHGSSSWAQGGLAAAIGPDDSPALHAEDTLTAGAGLCDREAVRVLTEGGPDAVQSLAELGVPFDRMEDGSFRLGREAAHGRERIVHVGGDEAGAAIMNCLVEAARSAGHIELRERIIAERLITDADGVCGAELWDIEGQRPLFLTAGAVILATGGLGGLYAVTTNPLFSQGQGIALAAEAGATLRDLEFVQFHPTGLDVGRDPAPLATEAIRGEGAHLLDGDGDRFMLRHHPQAELAPRDVVARGVAQAIAETGGAFLDVREAIGEAFAERFPTVDAACREAGIDPAKDLLPIAPAAHYHMGGVRTNINGQTSIKGLFAVGECASTGVHGANRLASNSLLEAIVFGTRIAEALRSRDIRKPGIKDVAPETLGHGRPDNLKPLRRTMADKAGLLRNRTGLCAALDFIEAQHPDTVGHRLALLTAKLVLSSALAREESRGAHQRTDHIELAAKARHSLMTLRGSDIVTEWEDVNA
ncbi:L-aspartate oxidase [Parvularcula lutaonensis]|uniref:L-aspartate oxidase n=1 Tax=Parvularcula lutaonensis TaxID=491923 RepID=A0ABV7M885_9PROT|nr:L-aspartate oxidase [Parvularcula lutaonensis]GGY43658.1 L-aspartate oxidase [Parvularcula lutaonensis]